MSKRWGYWGGGDRDWRNRDEEDHGWRGYRRESDNEDSDYRRRGDDD